MVATASTPARIELARIAHGSASSVPGVVALTSGPADRWQTGDERGAVSGVVCLPLAEGGLRVELHLVARMTPLPALADEVRDRFEQDAARAGLADVIGRIDVAFEEIDEPTVALPGEGR